MNDLTGMWWSVVTRRWHEVVRCNEKSGFCIVRYATRKVTEPIPFVRKKVENHHWRREALR